MRCAKMTTERANIENSEAGAANSASEEAEATVGDRASEMEGMCL